MSADYGRARFYGAHSNGYSNASRGPAQINKVIVHVTQGSWSSAINWFRDARSGVSAHYTVRSSDGFIGQSVRDEDIAYHAGNWTYNKTSIGIEHEGYVSNPDWFTAAMYRSSARLTAHLCNEYKIPVDRNHILGHNEVPGATHTDPGRHWDWGRYMKLVRSYANPRYQQIVGNASPRFRASSNWGTSSFSGQKHGGNYRYIRPRKVNDRARFKFRIPRRGKYKIYGRWPADPGYNSRTRFRILTSGGWVVRERSQRKNGGQWVPIGTFTMNAGDRNYVQIPRLSSRSGYIIADAVMIRSA